MESWAYKGMPASGEAATGKSVLADELMLPAATLRADLLHTNRAWMKRFLDGTPIKLCPHGKTTMAPDIFKMQLEDGAWGLTAATAHHVRIYRQYGVQRIILANQLVGQSNITWVVQALAVDPSFEFYCLVDSLAGAKQLSERVTALKASPLNVFIEIGRSGGRTGLKSAKEAIGLAKALQDLPGVRLSGVEAFEGVFIGGKGDDEGARSHLSEAEAALYQLMDGNFMEHPEPIYSIGGSAFMDLSRARLEAAAKRYPGLTPILRSGCYIAHDHGLYQQMFQESQARQADMGVLQPVLEVWGHVQSLPEPGVAIITMGKRDLGQDAGLPRPVAYAKPGGERIDIPENVTSDGMWDQHLKVTVPGDHPFEVGDLFAVGVSHPCTTFDKWHRLYLVDGDYAVTGTIETHF